MTPTEYFVRWWSTGAVFLGLLWVVIYTAVKAAVK
jgi:hypothetical protein